MPILSRIIASSAVAIATLLAAGPAPVDALVAVGGSNQLGHVAARQLGGVSPNHHALSRRKRNAHKNRKRCQARPDASSSSSSSTPAPSQGSGDSGNNGNTGNTGNTGNGNTGTTTQPPPTTGGTGSNKLILAWPNGAEPNMGNFFTGNAKYYYNWTPTKVNGNTGNVKFCAMLWGWNQVDEFSRTVTGGYTDCVLGMNEPNQGDQSNIDVWSGIGMWNKYIGPLASQGYSIMGSPAPTSAPDGLTWVQTFLKNVDVKPNVVCIHWYDVGFENFQQYVTNFWNGVDQRTIWVTEFACQNFNGGAQCSEGDIWNFVQQATKWMDEQWWIGGYAPFGFMRDMTNVNTLNQLMTYDGYPTALGSYFINSA